jgi:hypothetical protein
VREKMNSRFGILTLVVVVVTCSGCSTWLDAVFDPRVRACREQCVTSNPIGSDKADSCVRTCSGENKMKKP